MGTVLIIEGDAAMPGWLQEIGFMPMEMPADGIVADNTVTQGDTDDQALDIDWEELALSVSETDERVESQVPALTITSPCHLRDSLRVGR